MIYWRLLKYEGSEREVQRTLGSSTVNRWGKEMNPSLKITEEESGTEDPRVNTDVDLAYSRGVDSGIGLERKQWHAAFTHAPPKGSPIGLHIHEAHSCMSSAKLAEEFTRGVAAGVRQERNRLLADRPW